jgi:phosphate ABC transporter phosphate-binding protein
VHPEITHAAIQFHRRTISEIAFEDFAVVADCFDHSRGPIIIQPQQLPVSALDVYLKRRLQPVPAAGFWACFFLLLLVIAGLSPSCAAQRVGSLSEAKTLCVEPFTGGAEAVRLRDSLVRQLSKSRRFQLVQYPTDADVILKGSGQIWVRGYFRINPRTPGNDRQAVYTGYLSLEVVGAGHQTLWSWLVTPSRLAWSNVVDDMASHAARKLIEGGESNSASASPQSPASPLAHTELKAAGATFPAPLYQKWIEDFEQLHPEVRVSYKPVGSQLGIDMLAAGNLDFAGSDVAAESLGNTVAASQVRRIATVLGGVVPIYNLKGVSRDLRLTPGILADIYLGRVRRWNDPEIRRFNKGLDLPDAEIAVVHRADGSGTSWVWSDFLSKVSPAWSTTVGRGTTLQWPVGAGAEYNEGVAETVQSTPNSIGYVELTYAIQRELTFASVRNQAGEFIRADLDSLADAARESRADGLTPQAISNSPGKHAYPIAAFTWIIVSSKSADPAKRAALVELLRWILTAGQKECSALGYAPLPRETAESELRMLDSLL